MAFELEAMTADQLYLLHLDVTAALKKKLVAKKDVLDEQLQRLHPHVDPAGIRSRRPYPPVRAKFAIRINH